MELGFRFTCFNIREWYKIWTLPEKEEARNLPAALGCHPELGVLASRRTHCRGNESQG